MVIEIGHLVFGLCPWSCFHDRVLSDGDCPCTSKMLPEKIGTLYNICFKLKTRSEGIEFKWTITKLMRCGCVA